MHLKISDVTALDKRKSRKNYGNVNVVVRIMHKRYDFLLLIE